jgi:hypothetical protein
MLAMSAFPERDETTGDILVPVQTGGDDEAPVFGNYRLHDGKVIESPWKD